MRNKDSFDFLREIFYTGDSGKKHKITERKIKKSKTEKSTDTHNPLVVNITGRPGPEKSVAASYLYSVLEMDGIKCELLSNRQKNKVYEDVALLDVDPLYAIAKQNHILSRAVDFADVVICDEPLFTYASSPTNYEGFDSFCINLFNSYNNLTFYINSTKEYDEDRMMPSEEKSENIGHEILNIIEKFDIPFYTVDANLDGYTEMFNYIFSALSSDSSSSEDEFDVEDKFDIEDDWIRKHLL